MGLLMVAQRPLREPQWQTSVQSLPFFAPWPGPDRCRKNGSRAKWHQNGRVANEVGH